MARLVAQWRQSNESQASFARRHRIPTRTFWYWCRKLARDEAGVAPHRAPTFVPVAVTPPASMPAIEVVLRSGERLQIGADASPALVQAGADDAPRRMLTLSPAVRIYLATGATDLRRSIDGLATAGARAFHPRPALL
jgi:transposase-like protein